MQLPSGGAGAQCWRVSCGPSQDCSLRRRNCQPTFCLCCVAVSKWPPSTIPSAACHSYKIVSKRPSLVGTEPPDAGDGHVHERPPASRQQPLEFLLWQLGEPLKSRQMQKSMILLAILQVREVGQVEQERVRSAAPCLGLSWSGPGAGFG